jgi:hypothetical protein
MADRAADQAAPSCPREVSAWRAPKGGQRPLRDIATELEHRGYVRSPLFGVDAEGLACDRDMRRGDNSRPDVTATENAPPWAGFIFPSFSPQARFGSNFEKEGHLVFLWLADFFCRSGQERRRMLGSGGTPKRPHGEVARRGAI